MIYIGEYYSPSVSFPYITDPALLDDHIGTFIFKGMALYQNSIQKKSMRKKVKNS